MHDIRAREVRHRPAAASPGAIKQSINRNGNLYPTHPIGPVAWWMDINRGDRFSHLVSMSTKSRSLQGIRRQDLRRQRSRAPRSITSSATSTSPSSAPKRAGPSRLYHDTNTPRPRSTCCACRALRASSISPWTRFSSRAAATTPTAKTGERPRVGRRGRVPQGVRAEDLGATKGALAQNGGHGGVDYLELYRLIKNLQEGKPLDYRRLRRRGVERNRAAYGSLGGGPQQAHGHSRFHPRATGRSRPPIDPGRHRIDGDQR